MVEKGVDIVNIKERREQLGISQKELAERAKISQSFLCDIEQGRCKPSIDTAVKLAGVLEITDIKFWSAE
jgi:transcriptional regulator with XRE-family HTH domain